MRIRYLSCLGLIVAIGAPLAALADSSTAELPQPGGLDTSNEALEEIVVTAEHRAADIQKTPDSITVRSGPILESEGKFALSQIIEDVPGIAGGAATNSGSGLGAGSDSVASGLTIRGIPSNLPVAGAVTSIAPAAAVYVDGVYSGVGGSYDLDRVEVLRGPQGTLYGRSATSGLIAIHTADPDLDHLGGNFLAEFGDYSLQHYSAAVNLPVIDDVLGVRISGNRYQRDGYYADEGLGGGLDTTDGRVKVLFKPNSDLSILLGATLENNIPQNTQAGTLSSPNTFVALPPIAGDGHDNYRQYWGQLDWNIGFATLTYLPAFRTWTSEAFNDLRGAVLNLNQSVATPSDHFTTQELRLASNSGSKLTWQVGAFYYLNTLTDSDLANVYTPPGAMPPPITLVYNRQTSDKETYALGEFGELTFSPVETWRITAGLRHDYTRVKDDLTYQAPSLPPNPPGISTFVLNGPAGTLTFNNVTYKARLEHDLTASNLLYASVSTGFSPGDASVTTGATGNPLLVDLKAETLTSYEIGSKNRFLGDRLQINGSVYYIKYGAYQVLNNALATLGPGGTIELEVVPLLSPAEVLGAEVETIFQLTSTDRVGLNLAETNAYWVGKQDNPVALGPGVTTNFAAFYALNRVPGVEPFTANLSYDHFFRFAKGSTIVAHGDVRYLSPHDDTNIWPSQLAAGLYPWMRVGSEVIGDLNASWLFGDGKFSVSGYVRNVGDNGYKTAVRIIPIAGGGVGATPYDPRTYGFVLTARF
jgi:iron complex outermembrane receptor protein